MEKVTKQRFCDLCGAEVPYDAKKVPVLVDYTGAKNEWGVDPIEGPISARIRASEMDVCDDCLERLVRLRGTFGFYSPDDIEWKEG